MTSPRFRSWCAATRLLVLAPLAVALLAVPTAAQPADFGSFVTFGDSLTHNDILGIVNDKDQALYDADPMEALFVKGASAGDDLSNFARAGSTSNGLADQIDLYEFLVGIQNVEPATLVSLESGANDLLDNLPLLVNNAPGTNPNADAVITNIRANLVDAFRRMRQNVPGVRFIVWTLPDLSQIPRFFGALTPQQIENLRGHIERINGKIRRASGRPSVAILDADTLLRELVAVPPVLRGQALVPPPAFCDFDHLFADDIHPTGVSNAILANAAVERINEKWIDDIPPYTEDELADLARIP